MRRVYALTYALRPKAILNMSMHDLGNLFGETPAAQSWRIEKIFSGYLKKNGARGFKAAGQKSEESRAVYSQAQKGNTNRTKLKRPDGPADGSKKYNYGRHHDSY
jgi:hypothetical protein